MRSQLVMSDLYTLSWRSSWEAGTVYKVLWKLYLMAQHEIVGSFRCLFMEEAFIVCIICSNNKSQSSSFLSQLLHLVSQGASPSRKIV